MCWLSVLRRAARRQPHRIVTVHVGDVRNVDGRAGVRAVWSEIPETLFIGLDQGGSFAGFGGVFVWVKAFLSMS